MQVRVHKTLGFTVKNGLVLVQPQQHPQFLDDDARNSTGFDLLVKSGDLVVIAEPEKVVEPEKKESKKEK